MCSRYGRSTNQAFLAFQAASRHEKEDSKQVSDDEEDDDAMLMGNDGKFDVHEKIGKMMAHEAN
jgi:hypothetical protein